MACILMFKFVLFADYDNSFWDLKISPEINQKSYLVLLSLN